MFKLSKEEWLSEMPELIYKLKKDYGFYYSGFICRIQRDILEVINDKKNKHKHKIVLYNKDKKFFLVVYRKNDSCTYYTNEYMSDNSYNRIRYFENKFRKAYTKAQKELENELFNH